MKKLLVIVCLSSFWFHISAQQEANYFDPQPDNFMKQLHVLFKENAHDELEVFYKKLEKEYKDGKISESQQSKMVDILNIMHSRKMQVYPFYKNFIESVGNSYKSGYSEAFIDRWYNFVKGILVNSKKGNNKDFNIFIDFSNDLFTINALVSENSKSYTIEKRELTFRYQDNKIIANVPKTTLKGFFKSDTITIFNTSGEYNIMEKRWKGNEGEINWARVGIPKNEASCTFKSYTIDMSKPQYTIDSVLLSYPEYFPSPILGRLEDKITKEADFTTVNYPQFTSYQKNYPFNNKVAPNVNCSGGFKLKGGSVVVATEDGTPVNVTIFSTNGSAKIFSAEGPFAYFQKGNFIKMDRARVKIYVTNDSFIHPFVGFKYDVQKKELRVFKDESGSGTSRFRSTYHKVLFDADLLVWNIDEDVIDLKMINGRGKNAAKFISNNNFDLQTFNQARTAAAIDDPLSVLQKMNGNYPNGIPLETYINTLGPAFNTASVLPVIFSLEKDGFITYSSTNKTISVNNEYTDFYYKAYAKKSDYDLIRFSGFGKKSIGKYNIKTKKIEINNVARIPFNDSANVKAFPDDTSKVLLGNNRSLSFGGKLMAGRMDIFSNDYRFNYDSFQIKSDHIDRMRIHVQDKVDKATGEETVLPLKSLIEKFKGDIQINSRFNRSGMVSARNYPILKIISPAYVYYDHELIYNHAYPKTDFYFEIAPCKKDSLQYFDKKSLFYDGKLYAANIFPPFNEKLIVQSDLSLGFYTKTPPTGFTTYQNKGSFNGNIHLSNSGLVGIGSQTFQSVTFQSDSILYFPNNTTTLAKTLESKEQKSPVEYPQYTADSATIDWKPYADTMLIESHRRHPISMFNKSTDMHGLLLLSSKGLQGKGYLDFNEARIFSQMMQFKSTTMTADTAAMEIKSLGDKVTFKTPNVKAKMDFVTKIGDFKSNASDIATDFAYNRYKADINEFKWDINQKILTFTSPAGSKGSRFTSTHPEQDSLSFLAKKAAFNLVTSIINMDGVEEIIIADSRVIPDQGKVTIMPKGVMEPLINATIEGDTANNYHKFNEAKLDIHGKNDMLGYGRYSLLVNDKVHDIKLNSIRVTKTEIGKTKKRIPLYNYTIEGTGKVEKNQNLQIYRNTDFFGDVTIAMNRKFPKFDGKQRIQFMNPRYKTPWFEVNNEIDVEELQLNKKILKADNDQNLYTGFMIDRETNAGLYTNIMMPLRSEADQIMYDGNGIIKHAKYDNNYIFGDSSKIFAGNLKGNKMIYSDSSGFIKSEGSYNPFLKIGGIDAKMAGIMENNMMDSSFNFKGSIGFNITMDQKIVNALINVILTEFSENTDLNYTKMDTKKSYEELFHPKDLKSFDIDITKSNTIINPPKYTPLNLVLTDLSMEYDRSDNAFRSKPEFGLSMLGGRPINKKVNGFFEYGYGEYFDYFNLYFKTKGNREWLFITYADGVLGILSSNDNINAAINQIDPRKRIIKKSQKEYYQYTVAGDYDAISFTKRMAKGGKYNDEEKKPTDEKGKGDVDEKDLKNADEYIEKTPDQEQIELENAKQDSILKAIEQKEQEINQKETQQYEEAEKKSKEEALKKLEEEEAKPAPTEMLDEPVPAKPAKENKEPKEEPENVVPKTPNEKLDEEPAKEGEAPVDKSPEEIEKDEQKKDEQKEEKMDDPEKKEEPKSLFDKYF